MLADSNKIVKTPAVLICDLSKASDTLDIL